MDENKKALPTDIEAEDAVCAALIETPDYFYKLELVPADFYDSNNRLFYEIMPEFAALETRDFITLNELAGKRVADFDSFAQHILHCVSKVPSTDEHSVMNYANIVKEKSKRRAAIKVFEGAARDLYDLSTAVGDVNDKVISEILNESESGRLASVSADEYFDEFLTDLNKRKERGDGLAGASTGFGILDVLTGGLEDGKVYVIGGRPAMGKTAFALNIITNMVLAGKNVVFFSLEMQRGEIFKRVLSSISGVASSKIKLGKTSDEDEGELGLAFDLLGKRLEVSDNAAPTAEEILSYCTNLNRRWRNSGRKIDAVAIDYLQLMRNSNKKLDRRLAIGESSRMCKKMAKELDCPVILLSQLSRANESRDDKRPRLSDLRESGDIEQDADVVMFIHRPAYYDSNADEKLAEIYIAKNRDGEVGKAILNWDKNTTKFSQPEIKKFY